MQLRPPDLDNLAGTDTGRRHLSASSISMQLSCLRKWQWTYERRLERIDRPRPLTMGTAFHNAVELRDPVAGAQTLQRPWTDQAEYDQMLKDMAIVTGAAQAYLDRWGEEDRNVQREVEFLIRLRSPYTGAWSRTYDLKGFADGVIDHGDHLELVEDKFVGRVDPITVKRVRLDRQVGLESYALWRITGKPVRKIRYRWTKKPSIKQRQAESVDEYCQRVIDDYRDRPDFYLVEEQTYRTAEDLLEIEAELWAYAEQIRQAQHHGFFPRNTSHCSDYGGCQFIDLCAGDPDALSLYRVREDDTTKETA